MFACRGCGSQTCCSIYRWTLLLSEVPVVGQIKVVNQKTGQRKYPAEQNRGRSSDCTSLRSKRPIVTQSEDDIDWSSDD